MPSIQPIVQPLRCAIVQLLSAYAASCSPIYRFVLMKILLPGDYTAATLALCACSPCSDATPSQLERFLLVCDTCACTHFPLSNKDILLQNSIPWHWVSQLQRKHTRQSTVRRYHVTWEARIKGFACEPFENCGALCQEMPCGMISYIVSKPVSSSRSWNCVQSMFTASECLISRRTHSSTKP